MKSQQQIVMSKAWEIRREAAMEQNIKVGEIHFGECLKAAWAMIKKYGYELVAKVEALMATEIMSPIVQAADNKMLEMENISDRYISEIERKYQAI